MKNILKVSMVLAVAALSFSSCNCFKKMAKNQDQVSLTCNPEVLVLNNGKVTADIEVIFPAKYFNKKAELRVTPVIVFEGGEVAAPTKCLQGEKVKENYTKVGLEGGKFTHHVEFAYDERMQKSELQLRVEVKCPNGGCKEFTLINANNGAMPTKEEAAILAAGGAEAQALARKFGRTIAKGINTLQKDLNYAEAMQPVANNYKNVTTVVTKADVAYRINSSKVCKKAVETEALAALKAKVEENKANDRAKQTVYVNGYASPDGPEKFNDKLSNARSESGKKAVEKLLAEAGIQIDAASYGEDWEGFKEAVAASNIADKDLILQVLGMYDSSAQREKEIKNMSSVYKSLKTDVLPKLRRAQVVNSADITGKTDDEMVALVKAGNAAALDLEELLHIAEARAEVAVAALEFAASKYNDARVFNNLGMAYAEAGENAKALAAFEKALKAGGNSTELNNNIALAHLANGNVEKAKEYAKAGNAEVQALVNASEGNYAQASAKLEGYNAAIAQVMNGDLAAAKKSIANDNSAKADYLRAVIAVKEGNTNNAKAQLNSAISKDASLEAKAKKDVNLAVLF
jgi:outer membrane protein OmpA-like peptidoglycan-associated protein/Tfp pilus assembly protein PilF